MIVVNLLPPAAGGGLQNALSFVQQLADTPDLRDVTLVACSNGGAIHLACKKLGLRFYVVPSGRVGRVWFELLGGFLVARRCKARVVFTLFGNAPIISPGLYRISGLALSNLLHPEIQFWESLSPGRRFLKKVKDQLRLWAIRRSHEIIVETDLLAERARSGLFADRKVHVVYMEPSALVLSQVRGATQPAGSAEEGLRLLILSGPHPNKRIHYLAPILGHLDRLRSGAGLPSPIVVATLPEQHPQSVLIRQAFEDAKVGHLLRMIGPVPPSEVGTLLQSVDAVVNIAKLESFSNNWVEAWAAGLPLISTDAEWARASCGEGAIYIDPDEPERAAECIHATLSDSKKVRALRESGNLQLANLMRQGKKISAYKRILLPFLGGK